MEELSKTIRMLWAGEIPLRPAFWIYGFAVVLAFKWAIRALEMSGFAGSRMSLVLGALAVIYSVFIAVSIWRSAARFEGKRAWAWAARVGVIAWPMSIFWGP